MVGGIIFTSFLIGLFNYRDVWAQTGGKVYWSSCLSSKPFMYFEKMSVQGCKNACAKHNRCVAVSYHKVFKTCQFYDVITSLYPCVGSIVILKGDFPADEANACSGSCPISDCNRIPFIDSAETFGNMLDIGAVIKVKCLTDSSESYIECQPNGQWTQLPTCSSSGTSCGAPLSVPHSDETHSSTAEGSVATYTCHSGYNRFPSDATMSITCLNTGQWESISFTCQQVDCGTPPDVAQAQKTYSSTLASSTVTYTCDSGYAVSPPSSTMSVTCQQTGDWESISFTCHQVDCGTPPDVAQAQKTYSSTLASSTVTYTCDSGYAVSPPSSTMSVTCQQTGDWESISFTCQQVDCGTPPDVAQAQKSFSSTLASSTVTYTCDSGYAVSPPSSTMSVTCQQTGDWESISFTCQQVDCGTPPDVAQAQKSFSSTLASSTVTYNCDSGYTVSPPSSTMSVTCQQTGDWESISFTCQQVDCGTPPDVAQAQKSYSSTLANSTVTYNCDSGYTVSPPSSTMSVTCQQTGDWESISFTCQQVDCGTPPDVAQAQKSYSSTLANSTVTYNCDSGYTVLPPSSTMSVTCQQTGDWESISFTCQQVDCGTPPDVAQAQKSFSSTLASSTVTYNCDSGYTVSPPSSTMSVTCQQTGDWESISFTCQQVDCGTPPDVAQAQKSFSSTLASSTVTYTCDSGYTVSPPSSTMSVTCQQTGDWESISFTCQQVDCGTPPDVAQAQKSFSSTLASSTVTYNCDSGYTVSPPSSTMSVTCQQTGDWESISFTCQQVDCGTPPDVAQAQKAYSSTLASFTVTYTCDSGYAVSPPSSTMSVTCQQTGDWESISFTCQQVDCGTPPDVAQAQKSYSSTLASSTVTYNCDTGYTVSPPSSTMSVTCQQTGDWESISFTCQQVDCGTPPDVAQAQKSYSSTLANSTVTYTCESGYTVSPPSSTMSVTCQQTGDWESISFTCHQVDCGMPPDVAQAQKSYSSTLAGSTVTFTCDSGYTVSPPSSTMSVTCQQTGDWESISFTCQQVDCGTPPDVAQAQKSYSSTLAGSTVTYTCGSGYVVSPPGYTMSVTCQQTGDWESIGFSCTVAITPGSSCSTDTDCAAMDGRCLYTGVYSSGSRCYCKPLYEFNQTQSACTQVCVSYTSLQQYSDEYIRKHNVGDSDGDTLTEAECLTFCADTYGDTYQSVDYWHAKSWGTNCYCGSVTRQQVLDGSPDFLKSSSDWNMFSKTCV